jgi:hypothetical protein
MTWTLLVVMVVRVTTLQWTTRLEMIAPSTIPMLMLLFVEAGLRLILTTMRCAPSPLPWSD